MANGLGNDATSGVSPVEGKKGEGEGDFAAVTESNAELTGAGVAVLPNAGFATAGADESGEGLRLVKGVLVVANPNAGGCSVTAVIPCC